MNTTLSFSVIILYTEVELSVLRQGAVEVHSATPFLSQGRSFLPELRELERAKARLPMNGVGGS